MIEQVEANAGRKPEAVSAGAGYWSEDNVRLVAANGLKVKQRAISRPTVDHFATVLTGEGAALQKNRPLGLDTRLSR